ncbi:hypothetical protein [Bizionia myxarmorum]|uniref:Restriction endonuclease n=1 Tax=Bizionia myxarmorum TaxID=291186 RepID=A0A5D0RDZ3_9FLAO|nr:hypothetical protein [Bizionia myxarmorum]TYB79171.1 hypothetical protein ES674_05190 [Bizionia myxarmorum]
MKGSQYAVIKLVESNDFIKNINKLIKGTKAEISRYDNWMPKSLYNDKEAELKNFLKYNFNLQIANKIVEWWLYTNSWSNRTPVWDLISTCTINGKKGLLLVEGKAHSDELNDKPKKKTSDSGSKEGSLKNHERIGEAINEANEYIKDSHPEINISRDNCYQLSNRIAYSWWLANQGVPVVLVYLGFLNCHDMDYNRRKLFKNDADWQTCFNEHAKKVGVDTITNKWVDCGSSKFITICKSF